MEEAQCLIDIAYADQEKHYVETQLADIQLKRLRSHLRLHELHSLKVQKKLQKATARVGKLAKVVRKSGYTEANPPNSNLPAPHRRRRHRHRGVCVSLLQLTLITDLNHKDVRHTTPQAGDRYAVKME